MRTKVSKLLGIDFPITGYHEVQNPPKRYRIIDRRALGELLGVDETKVADVQNEWIEAMLKRANSSGNRSGARWWQWHGAHSSRT